jgi:hypothetical protein
MTEDAARALLRRCDGWGGIERWIAKQQWQAVTGGWAVAKELKGWRFTLHPLGGRLQVSAVAPGSAVPAVWTVTG